MTVSIVTWLWGQKYTLDHARRMKRMLDRNVTVPYEFHCIRSMRPLIRAAGGWDVPQNKCLRRIVLYSEAMRPLFGDKILQLDLDMVITGNIDHIVGDPAMFKVWKSGSVGAHGHAYNPSILLMETGHLDHVWRAARDRPMQAMREAMAQGWTGSDQSVLAAAIHPNENVWTQADGVYSWRDDGLADGLPDNARIVSFHGKGVDPVLCQDVDWVRENWR